MPYLDTLNAKFAGAFTTSAFRDNNRVVLNAEKSAVFLLPLLKCLKEECGFDFLTELGGIDYLNYPIQTLKVGSLGTLNSLGVAKAKGAAFLLASTSEVYGDPIVHPQTEEYWGNVNPIGIRGVYDEAKRFAESMTMAYHRVHKMNTHIVRIFNTYGPRMRLDDGRVVPNLMGQALRGEPMTVYGEARDELLLHADLVDGIYRLLTATITFREHNEPGRGQHPRLREGDPGAGTKSKLEPTAADRRSKGPRRTSRRLRSSAGAEGGARDGMSGRLLHEEGRGQERTRPTRNPPPADDNPPPTAAGSPRRSEESGALRSPIRESPAASFCRSSPLTSAGRRPLAAASRQTAGRSV